MTAEVFGVCFVKTAVGLVTDVLADLGEGHFAKGDEVSCNVHSLRDKRLLEGLSGVYFHKAGGLLFG